MSDTVNKAIDNVFSQDSYRLSDLVAIAEAMGKNPEEIQQQVAIPGEWAKNFFKGILSTQPAAATPEEVVTNGNGGGGGSGGEGKGKSISVDLKTNGRNNTNFLKERGLPYRGITKSRELLPHKRTDTTLKECLELIDPQGKRRAEILGEISEGTEAGQVYLDYFSAPYRKEKNAASYPKKIQKSAVSMLASMSETPAAEESQAGVLEASAA